MTDVGTLGARLPVTSPTFDPLGAAWRFDNGNSGSQGSWIGNTGGASNVAIPASSVAGAPYGSPLVAEAAPVVLADVPVDRRLIIAPTKQGLFTGASAISTRVYAYGPTSGTFSYNAYVWESMLQKWLLVASAVAGTFTATQFLTLTAGTLTANFLGSIFAVLVNANAAGAPYMAVSIH